MDATSEVSLKEVESAREELHTYLEQKGPTFAVIEELLKKYRSTCIDFIFRDFQMAVLKETEERLWSSHGRINNRFRELLARFREGEGKKKHVERRKMETHFLDFIKSSMRFYRGYIQRLASHFAGVPKILEIARNFHLDTLSIDPPIQANGSLQQMLLESCYLTLMRLGDLSRYRETELRSKDRNWGPAKGYYDLATALRPSSGLSYNALAVLALADDDHFRALYYLYRAVSVPDPPQLKVDNLKLECKKILDRLAKQKPVTSNQGNTALSVLQTRFALFHAKCYEGRTFEEHKDVETEMLGQLITHLREGPVDGVLIKFCLVNIAAEARIKELLSVPGEYTEKNVHTWVLLQGLNVRTFSTLLSILTAELETIVGTPGRVDARNISPNGQLSKLSFRILPSLAHYSTWLLEEVKWLIAQQVLAEQEALISRIQEFWKLYAETLTLLNSRFPIQTLSRIGYLLDEEEDTIAFVPFRKDPLNREDMAMSDRYYSSNGAMKAGLSDAGVHRRPPNDEMLFRIKMLVSDGQKLARSEGMKNLNPPPLIYAKSKFVYQGPDEAESQQTPVQKHTHVHALSSASISRDNLENAKRTKMDGAKNLQESEQDTASESTDTSGSLSEAMRDMVDDLVEPETSEISETASYHKLGPRTPTMNTISAFSSDCIPFSANSPIKPQDLVRQMQRSPNGLVDGPTAQPSALPLVSIWTPRPGETSSRPGTSHRTGPAPTSAGPSQRSSAGQFQDAIAQQQQQLQLRSSPQQSLQPSWSSYETPTGMHSMQLAGLGIEQQQVYSSPWQKSSPEKFDSSGGSSGSGANVGRKLPQRALFGAIGEKMPRGKAQGDRTPTSGQRE